MAIIQFPKNGPITLTLPVTERSLARIRFDPIEKQARAVPPEGLCNWVEENIRNGVKVTAVNIEGPGDPLADIDRTLATLSLFRHKFPDLALGLTALGIHGEKYAGKLRKAGVQNITLLIDAIDRRTADKLYAWIRPARKTIPLEQATPILMAEQQAAIKAFVKAGCTVTVRSTVYPGFNDDHMETIAEAMAGCGAAAMVLKGYQPSAGEEGAFLAPPDCELMQNLLNKAAKHLPTTRAPQDENLGGCPDPTPPSAVLPKPTTARPNVAVVSSNGMEVDLHLGQAYQVLIYGPREDGLPCLLATRPVSEPGGGGERWQELGGTLADCFTLLAASAGESPRKILAEQGITVLICDNDIAATVDRLYGGGKKGKKSRK